ncbi:ATP-binding protein [Subdoligranulum variabile]|uniref:Sensor histidine kinase NatK-like C-terminal domain-containing protein n=1 Tax=Subdoligranulum variabile DSM 15176 TaxID=411471 RepID=D1PQW3_9FIRM|nr:GHKL domain-containing protein [Subdoligranulum variabile]EFB74978.1 hypothetical protein SUBVAR_06790 [Subdoligranulum variabile DSM 15176]UWP67103.1 GHKL domain-containing protein [Subdoligranulum variabile]
MLQLTQLSVYKVIFMAELLAAEALFCRKLRRRSLFWGRLVLSLGVCFAAAVLCPAGAASVGSYSALFFALFFVTLVGCRFCFEESWWNLLFCAIAGYSVQHITFVAYNMIVTGLGLTGLLARMGTALNPYGEATIQSALNPLTILAYVDCYFLFYWYFGYFLGQRMSRGEDLSLGRKPLIAFSGLGVAVNIVLHMVTVLHTSADAASVLLENVYNLLCCVLLLFLQFGVLSRRHLEQDRDLLRQMLAQKEEQYRIRQESMELINIKHHDLKHQLGLLRQVVDQNALRGMEEAVNRYDTLVRTGNDALDLVLGEKSMLCQAKGITFSCIADGARLAGMETGDIYTLFGNATENAIEYLQTLSDPEKRFLHVSVKGQGALAAIHVENYYEGPDRTGDAALPRTTKENKSYHGFGLRSIQLTAEKYGGEMSVHAKDHLFCVDVILPEPVTAR